MNPFPRIDDVIEHLRSEGRNAMARAVEIERDDCRRVRESNRTLSDVIERLRATHGTETDQNYRSPTYRAPAESDGFTLIEVLVSIAIVATLVGFLAAGCGPRHDSVSGAAPPPTIQMVTVQHDGHWWILCRETCKHHPDCPCRSRQAEGVDK